MIKKKIFLSLTLLSNIAIIPLVVSCGSESTDFKVMNWAIDENKVKQEAQNYATFNNLTFIDKINKVIKNPNANYELDRYTTEAIDQNWFEQISIIDLNDPNSKSYKLIFKLKNSQVIKTANNQTITKYCPYRLPNNQLVWEFNFNI